MLYPEIVLQSLGRKEKQPVFTAGGKCGCKDDSCKQEAGNVGRDGSREKGGHGTAR